MWFVFRTPGVLNSDPACDGTLGGSYWPFVPQSDLITFENDIFACHYMNPRILHVCIYHTCIGIAGLRGVDEGLPFVLCPSMSSLLPGWPDPDQMDHAC